jgi:hypothetical protein
MTSGTSSDNVWPQRPQFGTSAADLSRRGFRRVARGAVEATSAGRAPGVPRFRRAAAACVRAARHGWATAVLREAAAPARAAVPLVLRLASAYQPRGRRAARRDPSRRRTGALSETCVLRARHLADRRAVKPTRITDLVEISTSRSFGRLCSALRIADCHLPAW